MALASVGASLVLMTVRSKLSVTLSPAVSVAVIVSAIAPTLALRGVPEKLRVNGSKVNHEGKAKPSARVAVRLSVSPASISVNTLVGSV